MRGSLKLRTMINFTKMTINERMLGFIISICLFILGFFAFESDNPTAFNYVLSVFLILSGLISLKICTHNYKN